MVPSDDRLNSKFSIVSFVASEGANYNEDELKRSKITYSGLLLLNQTLRCLFEVVPQHTNTFPSLVLKSCPHGSENQILPGRITFYLHAEERRGVMTRLEGVSAGTVQLSARRATLAQAKYHILYCSMRSLVPVGCGTV